jgi:hypothetical protein
VLVADPVLAEKVSVTPKPLPSLLEGVASGFKRKLNSLKSQAYSAAGQVLDVIDDNVARPLVKAENRIKVAALQVQVKANEVHQGVNVVAEKGVEVAQVAVDRLKWVYLGLAVVGIIVFIANIRQAFGRK